MTQTGSKTKVYIGLEAVEGTRATTLIPIEVDSFNENDKITPAERTGAKGTIAGTHGSEIVRKMSEVQLAGDVGDKMIGLIFAGIFGQNTTSADDPETGVNTHNYSVLDSNNHPTYSIVFADSVIGEYRECLGCQIDTADFIVDQEAFAKFDVKFIGRASESGANPNTSYIDDFFYTNSVSQFFVADSVANLDSATPLCMQNGKISFEKNAKAQWCLGETPKKCYNGRMNAKIELTIEYEDKAYIDLERDNTARATRIKFKHNGTIGTTTNPEVQVTFDSCKVRELTRGRELEDILTQSFALKTENVISTTAKVINTKNNYVAD